MHKYKQADMDHLKSLIISVTAVPSGFPFLTFKMDCQVI